MNDFSKILDQAKEIEKKVKESQEKIKNIEAEGSSGGGLIKILLNGDGEILKVDISPKVLSEEKTMLEDLIIAAHNDAKSKLKKKTSEEISKITGGVELPPGFKLPF